MFSFIVFPLHNWLQWRSRRSSFLRILLLKYHAEVRFRMISTPFLFPASTYFVLFYIFHINIKFPCNFKPNFILYRTGENEHLIDQFLLIHSYKIVVEKSCYEELIKQTGRTTEKSMCRIYIMCTLKDIDVMTSHTSRDKFLTNGKRKSENVLEESIKKQICSVKGISNE